MLKKIVIFLFVSVPVFAMAQEIGQASFYAHKFHGRKTACGEIYDMHDLTAAHRKFPFGTLLRVTNLSNEKSVLVRVTDRGPFIKKRIVDVSYAAANALGFVSKGVANVEIKEVIFKEKYFQPIEKSDEPIFLENTGELENNIEVKNIQLRSI